MGEKVEVGVWDAPRREIVREKGGRVEIGKAGRRFSITKAQLSVRGQYRTIRSHPLISVSLPIRSQTHSVRLACEGQIRLLNHAFCKFTFPKLRCVLRYFCLIPTGVYL